MVEIVIYVAVGFVLGLWIGYLWTKAKTLKQCEEDQELFRLNLTREKKALQRLLYAANEKLDKLSPKDEVKEPTVEEIGIKPDFLAQPQGEKDDLKKISGIGAKLEERLNELGIFHYEQIAHFSQDNIIWIDNHLSFKGRIKRDNWVGQAQILAKGEETEFSKKYTSHHSH